MQGQTRHMITSDRRDLAMGRSVLKNVCRVGCPMGGRWAWILLLYLVLLIGFAPQALLGLRCPGVSGLETLETPSSSAVLFWPSPKESQVLLNLGGWWCAHWKGRNGVRRLGMIFKEQCFEFSLTAGEHRLWLQSQVCLLDVCFSPAPRCLSSLTHRMRKGTVCASAGC